jgi:anti-anti-sigma factor
MRGRSTVVDVSALAPGDHACWGFASDEARASMLAQYVHGGVERDERIVYLADGQAPDAVAARLAGAGVPVGYLLGSGQLLLLDARSALAPGGRFDGGAVLQRFGVAAAGAAAEGYTGVRTAADVGWLLSDSATSAAFLAFELQAGRVLAGSTMTALCGHDTRRCAADARTALAAVHPARAGDASDASFGAVLGAGGEVLVAGEVDLVSADAWRRVLAAAACEASEAVTLDLADLCFIDVAGLRAVAALAVAGTRVTLRSPRPIVRKCLPVLGVDALPGVEVQP